MTFVPRVRTVASRATVAGLLVVLLAAGASARAQEAGTEKERRKAARAEQAEKKKAEEAAKETGSKEAAAKAESDRLSKLGVEPGDTPLESRRGFFVQLDVASSAVSGADRTVARVGDVVSSAATAEEVDTQSGMPPLTPGQDLPDAFTIANVRPVRLTRGTNVTPRLELGWRTGSGAGLTVGYWSYSASSSASAASSKTFPSGDAAQGALEVGGIDNQGFENTDASFAANPDAFARAFGTPRLIRLYALHGADSVSAVGNLEIAQADVRWGKVVLVRKRFELSYRVGLSAVDIKRTDKAMFTWHSFERSRVLAQTTSVENVEARAQSRGFGATAGIGCRVGLTRNRSWSMAFALDASGFRTSESTSFRDAHQLTAIGLDVPPDIFQDVDDSGDGFLTQVEGDVAIERRLGKRARIAIGFRQARWLGVLEEQRFPSVDNPALLETRSRDLTIGGPYARIGVTF